MKNCTRFFTQEQIDEIRMRLAAIQGAKDSQFEKALPIDGTEQVAIVQYGKNKLLDISQLQRQISGMDETPKQGSGNAVTSNGIYNFVYDVIGSIPTPDGNYLYITSDSEMYDYLIHGAGMQYDQNRYNMYCQQVMDALEQGAFIIIDNAVCLTQVSTSRPPTFTLRCISDVKNVFISAYVDDSNVWHLVHGTGESTNKYLIDNTYLNNRLSDYMTTQSIQGMIENTPTQGSSNLVNSGGIYTAIQELRSSIVSESQIFRISSTSDMWDKLLKGSGRYQAYAQQVFEALQANKIIVLDNFICRSEYSTDPESFMLYVNTTEGGFIVGSNKEGNIWSKSGQTASTGDNLVLKSQLKLTLNDYTKVSDLNTYITGMQNTISQLQTSLNNLRTEYEGRMENTPKYHKLNWLTEEEDPGSEDTHGGYEITDASSAATAAGRFDSLWWAIKDSTLGDRVNKLILYYNMPILYIATNNIDDLSQATAITVRIFDGKNMVSYSIRKRTRGDEVYLYVLPTPYEVTDPDDAPSPDPTPDPEPAEP